MERITCETNLLVRWFAHPRFDVERGKCGLQDPREAVRRGVDAADGALPPGTWPGDVPQCLV